MRFIQLLLSRLELYFRRNKLTFCLMILTGILTSIMQLYFYGNLLPIVFNRTSDEAYYRTYTAQINPMDLAEEDLDRLRESDLLSSIEVRATFNNVLIYTDEAGKDYGRSVNLAADLTNRPVVIKMSGSTDLTNVEPFSAIVPGTLYTVDEFGDSDTWYFLNKPYTIVGKSSSDYVYVPYETFVQQLANENFQWELRANFVAEKSGITVMSAVKYSSYQEDEVLALLQSIFPETPIETPYVYTAFDMTNSYQQGVYMCILYAVCMISFLMLFLYLVGKSADVTAIYRIVGATGDTVALLHFWEVSILSLGSSLIGILIHVVLYKPLFSKMNLVRELSYRFTDYCLVLFVMVIIMLVLSIPFIWRATRLSPIAARRAAE